MFQLYLPEMHMDAKLQVILKGILVTVEDGVKFSVLFFIFLFFFSQKSFAHYLHAIKNHWLSKLYITMMAVKCQRHEMEMGKYANFLDL